MDSKFPVLLFPLRVETRFEKLPAPAPPGSFELWIRVFPDDIALNRHNQDISATEKAAGDQFWQKVGINTTDFNSLKSPWRALATAYGVPRASWIAQATQPGGAVPTTKVPGANFKKTLAELMPDTLSFYLYDKDGKLMDGMPKTTSPGTLAWEMSLDWSKTKTNVQAAKDALPDWMWDFNKAVTMKRGIIIPFTLGQYENIAGFSKLIVIGTRSGLSNTPANEKVLLEKLFKNHRFSPQGMEFVPPGTPTNNTSNGNSGYSLNPDPDTALQVELGAPLFQTTSDTAQKTDGQELAEALGIDPIIFSKTKNSQLKTRRNAEIINRCLWPATLGYFLEESLVKPSYLNKTSVGGGNMTITEVSAQHILAKTEKGELRLDVEALDRTRDFFVRHVKSRGTLPSIRIGKQPYGFLPVSPDLFSEEWIRSDYDPDLSEVFFGILIQMRDRWEAATKIKQWGTDLSPDIVNVDYLQSVDFIESTHVKYMDNRASDAVYGYSKITDAYERARRFLQILGLQPRSPKVYHRYGLQESKNEQTSFTNYNLKTKRNFGTAFNNLYSIFPLSGDDLVLGQIRFLDKMEPLSTLVDTTSGEATRLLPKEISEVQMVLENGQAVNKTVYFNYIDWLLKSSIPTVYNQSTSGPNDFANSRSLLYMLLRNALMNETWDTTMRLYEKSGLRDFRVKNFPLNKLEAAIQKEYGKTVKLKKSDMDIDWGKSGLIVYTPSNPTLEQMIISFYFSDSSWGSGQSVIEAETEGKRLDQKLNRLNYRNFILGYQKNDFLKNDNSRNPIEKSLEYCHFANSRIPFLFLEIQRGDLLGLESLPPTGKMPMWQYLQDLNRLKTKYPVESAGLFDFRDRLAQLSQISVEELERLMTEHLDLGSHRLDAWMLGIVSHRLSKIRANNASKTGSYIGAYGYLENLRYKVGDPTQPSSGSYGFVHAPSLDQAVTAAILRAGDKAAGDNLAFRTNLSSARARRALEMVEGFRNGLNKDEVFKKLSNGATDPNDQDALADLWTAEALFQLVKGNVTRAGAALDMMTKGGNPPEPEVVSTPRSGITLTNRAGLCWSKNNTVPSGWGTTLTPRAITEPSLNFWLGDMLGNPTNVKCSFVPKKRGLKSIEVNLSELNLQPIDLLYLAEPSCELPDSDLSKYVRSVALAKMSVEDTSESWIPDYKMPLPSTGGMTFSQLFYLLRKIGELLGKGRPLKAEDMMHPGFPVLKTCIFDYTDAINRVTNLWTTMKSQDSSLTKAINDLALEVKLANQGDVGGGTGGGKNPGKSGGIIIGGVKGDVNTGGGWPPSNPPRFNSTKFGPLKNILPLLSLYNIQEGFSGQNMKADLAGCNALLATARKLQAILQTKIIAIETAKNEASLLTAAEARRKVELCQNGVKAVFGENFFMAPLLLVNQKSAQPTAAENQNQLNLINPAILRKDLSTWLSGIASVRPKMGLLEETVFSIEMLLPDTLSAKKPWIAPVQLPSRTTQDKWVGLALPDTYWSGHVAGERQDKLSLIFNFPASITQSTVLSGLLLDEWTEVIPAKEQTTGLAYHYNQPNARAPQSLLLAVAPTGTTKWTPDALKDCVLTAIRLAKMRAFEPEHLMPTPKRFQSSSQFDAWSHLLPGVLARVTDFKTQDEISADFGANITAPGDNGLFTPRPKTGGSTGQTGGGTGK